MKRIGYLFEQVVAFPNLLAAFEKARKGKRGRQGVERFARRLEPELFWLQEEIESGNYRPGEYMTFTVHDPKERLISVAPFRDRVLHHALIRIIQPHLERGMDADSYGCRVGKGTDGALDRAGGLARRYPWCLKADVRKFFASVRHDLLLGQLQRLFKDRRLLDLLAVIVASGGDGRGLPIGNLTSQWFANLFLTPLDRHVRTLGAGGYIRYMDDILVFHHGRAAVAEIKHSITAFVGDRLDLSLKPAVSRIYPTGDGVPFLGFRVTRRGLRVRRPTWMRYRQRVRHLEWEHREGRLSVEDLAARIASMTAHLDRADSKGLRRRLFKSHPLRE